MIILHGVYPEPKIETLRFTQGEKWRRVQDDTSCQILPLRFNQGQNDNREANWYSFE